MIKQRYKHMSMASVGALAMAGIMTLADNMHFKSDPWEVKLYAPGVKALVEINDGEEVPLGTPKASDMVCMSKDHFGELVTKFRAYRAHCPATAEAAP